MLFQPILYFLINPIYPTTIKKWGNSPSVRLPVAIMKAAFLNVDDTVNITVEDGRIVIIPVKAKEYSLDALLAGITPENVHEKVNFGSPVGKELL
ncbi:AbrB/MazE/SpoVT family DNA-binding domain-containing protein [Photorhabdus caribbeanensis]|uniref:AbrB/MazE/SpoVT family DNA-binding domain-containing protein n=1 Tax=Photorhabdus caribbeanensis TaxID=1004165 RepID=UPI001BD3CD91|nr:AbrB/MazE/SpoVT family DNA-binding domain-containing protein [Photorhabdus caribbeanensis]MBS9426383.1 AbrB/MazE/SpoVT family DNA-binding domain-containing protein [Photorhabdus caribbeanensis]